MRPFRWTALLLAAAAISQAQAQVVIYRCTDASGALTVQNDEPCPKGTKQERSVVEPPPPLPAYVPSSSPQPAASITAAPEPAATEGRSEPSRPDTPPPAVLAAADRLPPPPIYQCNTWDNGSYLSEDPAPKPRCVRLQTTGLGGNPENGAGAACEMKYDQCQRVPDGAACDGWVKRQREIESGWRFARGEDKATLQEEFARVARILSDTTCGT
ncbi:DUF4124 domain-containing protein [Luteimonas vadosa]|uniref:DUF4124 domain-containing protein n=1 Tax=Luteimonas vadosa TaxID=1165507 RepID=A0ABP9DQL6_9GAMM